MNRRDAGTQRPDPLGLPLPCPDCRHGRFGRSPRCAPGSWAPDYEVAGPSRADLSGRPALVV